MQRTFIFAGADFGNISQRFAIVHQHDVTAVFVVFAQAELAVKHPHNRAELNAVPFHKENHAFSRVEPGNVSDFQRYSLHGPAEKLKRHGHACVPFQDFLRLKFDQCEDDSTGRYGAPFCA